MLYLDQSLDSPALSLALEEALLDAAEDGEWNDEFLRVWDSNQYFAVIGRGSRISEEVNLEFAAKESIPVFRRISGGAAIVAGPGCLLYAVLLSLERRPELRMVDTAHQYVMQTMLEALRPLVPSIDFKGTCDLVVGNQKVSGNSLRVRRNWLLYHGTFLLKMDLSLIDRLLHHPPREPEYRSQRRHGQFVANLNLDRSVVAERLRVQWDAHDMTANLPMDATRKIAQEKYWNANWNHQR